MSFSILLSLFQVDQGLQTGLAPGMKLEVCVRAESDSPYWVANIITTCGQLLLLRYEGYQDDRRADFWCDIMTADLHPLGWSRQHGKTMRAPEGEAWRVWALLFYLFELVKVVKVEFHTADSQTPVWKTWSGH